MTQWGLDALFNPAKRHMDEEKQRLQSTREEVGDSSGGKRIDLGSGKVVIERAGKDEEDDTNADPEAGAAEARADSDSDEPSAEADRAPESAPDSAPDSVPDSAPGAEPTTAAERARLRHRNRRAAG